MNDAESSRDADSCVNQTVHKSGRRIRDRREKCSPQRTAPEPLVYLVKPLRHIFSFSEHLHNLLVLYHFFNQLRLFSPDLRLEPEHIKGLFCNKSCHKEGNRRNENYHKSNAHIYRQHKSESSHNGSHPGKELCKSHQKSVGELIHVRDHAADHISRRMPVNVFQRQDLDLAEGLVPDIPHNLIGHFIVAHIHKPLGKGCNQRTHADLNHYPEHRRKIHLSF